MNRWIKCVAVWLLPMLCCAFASCDTAVDDHHAATEAPIGIVENNEYEYEYVGGYEFSYSPYYTPSPSRYSYEQLTEAEQRLYDGLKVNIFYSYPKFGMFAMYKTKQVIVEGAVLSEAQIRTTVKALYDDNPYLFWLNRYQMAFDYLADEEGNYTAVQVYSLYPPGAIKQELEAIKTEADAFFAEVPEGLSDYELEKYVHDEIIDRCTYDNATAEPKNYAAANDPDAHEIYGCLVRKNAVCDAYARTMQFLLNGLGVDCVGVTGEATSDDGETGLHMWNAVLLEDKWYVVDATWDDQEDEFFRHHYFNVSDELLSDSHEPSALLSELTDEAINGEETNKTIASNLFVPVCGSMEQNYFVRDCPHLTDYDGAEVKEALYRAAKNREPSFAFYVDENDLDFDEAFRYLFQDTPPHFWEYQEEVNRRLEGYAIADHVEVYRDEKLKWIYIALSYDGD